MINEENVTKWIKALRSGDYRQGKNALARKSGGVGEYRYCCLGVACELAVADGIDITVSTTEAGCKLYNKRGDLLPAAAMEWLGTGRMAAHDLSGWSLPARNDVGTSFAEIADELERAQQERALLSE